MLRRVSASRYRPSLSRYTTTHSVRLPWSPVSSRPLMLRPTIGTTVPLGSELDRFGNVYKSVQLKSCTLDLSWLINRLISLTTPPSSRVSGSASISCDPNIVYRGAVHVSLKVVALQQCLRTVLLSDQVSIDLSQSAPPRKQGSPLTTWPSIRSATSVLALRPRTTRSVHITPALDAPWGSERREQHVTAPWPVATLYDLRLFSSSARIAFSQRSWRVV